MASNRQRYDRQLTGATAAWRRVGAVSAASVGTQAAREAGRLASYTAPTIVLSAQDAGDGTATILIAEHTRVYPVRGSVDVPDILIAAASITGLAYATEYFVYYDDETLADTTPAFLTTEDVTEGQVGAAAGRHLVGRVTTPAMGAANTGGSGGSTPPGGGGGKLLDHSTL